MLLHGILEYSGQGTDGMEGRGDQTPPECFTHDQANRKADKALRAGREIHTVTIRSAEIG